MNMNRLRATMVLHGENMTDLANALSMSRRSLSAKMNGHREFTVGDVLKVAEHYGLKPWEVEDIFFSHSAKEQANASTAV